MPKCELNKALFVFDIYSNPLLTKEDIEEEIESLGGIDSPHVQRELFCKIIKDFDKVVVPEFDETRHVKPIHLPSHAKWLTTLDFGGTVDKHGLVLTYWDFKKAQLVVYGEHLLKNNTATDIIVEKGLELEAMVPRDHKINVSNPGIAYHPRRIADCPGQIKIDLAKLKYPIYTPKKEKGSWEGGQNEVRVALRNNQIVISPRCKMLIATLRYGRFTDNRKDWQRTEEFGHLDLLAALIYAWRHKDISNPYPDMYKLTHESQYVPEELQRNQKSIEDAFF